MISIISNRFIILLMKSPKTDVKRKKEEVFVPLPFIALALYLVR